jgi:hypothetical protein
MAANRFTLWITPSFADSPLQNALVNGLCSLEKVYPLNKIPASKSAAVYKFSCDSGNFYFKQYYYRSLCDIIKHTVRPSRAARTMKAAAMLKTNGFAAPEIIVMGCRCKGIFNLENFLLTREVENALSLHAFFEQRYGRSISCCGEKRKFIRAVGGLVGRLHAKNISHGDLRLGNVLVHSSSSQQPITNNKQPVFEFFFLDNERTVQYVRLPDRLRLKNLVQCNMHRDSTITRTDRLRFFSAYLAENPALAPAAKRWLKKINRKTLRRLAKQYKKGSGATGHKPSLQ